MKPAELRARLTEGLLDFAWDEWAQMGVLAAPARQSPWAEDPEALVVFTLEVGRSDPRLFDELLDWLVVNESFLTVRRLRSMVSGPEDQRLLDAVLIWLAQFRPSARLKTLSAGSADDTPERLFRGLSTAIRKPDPAFAAAGFHRPIAAPTGKARNPDLRMPINLALRLRQLLGVGARAEVVRHLLTSQVPAVNVQVLTRSAGYAHRNVHEALTHLHAAGAVTQLASGSQQRYEIDREAWARLLDLDVSELPEHRDWPQLLSGLRTVLRWLLRPDLDELSEYLLASQARDLLAEVRDDFEHAGVPVGRATAVGAWLDLEALVDNGLRLLGVAHDVRADFAAINSKAPRPQLPALRSPGGPDFFQIYSDDRGAYRWRLKAANGEIVATSGESFSSRADAARAAESAKAGAGAWRYEIFADAAGRYRWRARASNGQTVASSLDSFASHSSAERAAHQFRTVGLDPC